MLEDRVGRLEGGLDDHAHEVVDPQVAVDRFVVASDALGGDLLAAGVRVEDHGVARGDHADGVPGNGRQRVRYGGDRPNHAERGVLDHGQPVVAAIDLAPHELDAGGHEAERLDLLDLVLQAADPGLFHLHRAELDALVDGDAADVRDHPAALLDRAAGEPLEGVAGGGHGLVRVGEEAEPPDVRPLGQRRGRTAVGTEPAEHFLNHIADDGFVDLHGW